MLLWILENYVLSDTSGFSEGCQTVYYEDYLNFGKSVGFLSKTGDYTITEEERKDDIYKLGNYMKAWIGTTSKNK